MYLVRGKISHLSEFNLYPEMEEKNCTSVKKAGMDLLGREIKSRISSAYAASLIWESLISKPWITWFWRIFERKGSKAKLNRNGESGQP